MASHKRSKSSALVGVTAAASTLLIGGGLAGIGYGVYCMVRSRQFDSNPYKVVQHAIAPKIEEQQLMVLEDSVARTHYTNISLATDKEKEETVIQILSGASLRAVAAPLVVSVNTFVSVVVLSTVETLVRIKKRKLTAPVRASIMAELNKIAVTVDVFFLIESEVKDALRAYTEENLKIVTPPGTFVQFLQSVITDDLLSNIISRVKTVINGIFETLSPDSILHLPLLILSSLLSGDFSSQAVDSFDATRHVSDVALAFFDGLSREFTDLIASKSGFQFAYYARPLLSLNLPKYFPGVDETLVNVTYLLARDQLEIQ